MLIFELINFIFALGIFFLTLSFVTGAPFVPSGKKTSKAMIELADIQKNSVIYDLGSGDGRLLFMAAEKGGKKITGVEINLFLVLFTKIKIVLTGKKNIFANWGDFWRTDISDATIVFVYLLPWKMQRLATKLEKELKPGTLVVSNSFIFPNWKIKVKDEKLHVYVFEMHK